MGLFENISKVATEVAQKASKKSGELYETTKLTLNISCEEDKIQELYASIGEVIYNRFKSNAEVDAEFKQTCQEIKVVEDGIIEARDKIMEMKGLCQCSSCKTAIERTVSFCPNCGAKTDPVVVAEPEASNVCPTCSKVREEGHNFCSGCGNKFN